MIGHPQKPMKLSRVRFPSMTFSDTDSGLSFHCGSDVSTHLCRKRGKHHCGPHLFAGTDKNGQAAVPGPSTYRKSQAISTNHSLAGSALEYNDPGKRAGRGLGSGMCFALVPGFMWLAKKETRHRGKGEAERQVQSRSD